MELMTLYQAAASQLIRRDLFCQGELRKTEKKILSPDSWQERQELRVKS